MAAHFTASRLAIAAGIGTAAILPLLVPSWATLTTFAGSITSIFVAQALLKKFSGKGLVPDALVMCDRDAFVGAAVFQPLFVRAVRWKQVVMPFDF